MKLDFKSGEEDFFRALGITSEDEKAFILFKKTYYAELGEKFQSKKIEAKLNDVQLKKYALGLSSHSKMFQTALGWWEGYSRKDQLVVLLLGDIFFRMAASNATKDLAEKMKSQKPKRRIIN